MGEVIYILLRGLSCPCLALPDSLSFSFELFRKKFDQKGLIPRPLGRHSSPIVWRASTRASVVHAQLNTVAFRPRRRSFVNGKLVNLKHPHWFDYLLTPKLKPNIERLINACFETRQLARSQSRHYRLRFLTWKRDPALLELYDLIELRQTSKTKENLR